MSKLPNGTRVFLWGVLFGILLVPVLYMLRSLWKSRNESVSIDDSDWP